MIERGSGQRLGCRQRASVASKAPVQPSPLWQVQAADGGGSTTRTGLSACRSRRSCSTVGSIMMIGRVATPAKAARPRAAAVCVLDGASWRGVVRGLWLRVPLTQHQSQEQVHRNGHRPRLSARHSNCRCLDLPAVVLSYCEPERSLTFGATTLPRGSTWRPRCDHRDSSRPPGGQLQKSKKCRCDAFSVGRCRLWSANECK